MKSNYKFGEVHRLYNQIEASEKRVECRQIFESDNGGVTLLAFKAGEKLDTHLSPADLMLIMLDGKIEFTMNEITHRLSQSEFILLGTGVPHSVNAITDAKILLVKIKP